MTMGEVLTYVQYLRKGDRGYVMRLQSAGGDDLMAFGEGQLCGTITESPAELTGPVFCNGGEMQQDDTQAQITVDFVVIGIGTADQGDAAIVDNKSISLTI